MQVEEATMSHIVTFDDRMLDDALGYARCLRRKLEAMEEPTCRVEQALSLMEYVQSEIESEIAERFEARRGTEEAYR